MINITEFVHPNKSSSYIWLSFNITLKNRNNRKKYYRVSSNQDFLCVISSSPENATPLKCRMKGTLRN